MSVENLRYCNKYQLYIHQLRTSLVDAGCGSNRLDIGSGTTDIYINGSLFTGGATGPAGPTGPRGDTGAQGATGSAGLSQEQIFFSSFNANISEGGFIAQCNADANRIPCEVLITKPCSAINMYAMTENNAPGGTQWAFTLFQNGSTTFQTIVILAGNNSANALVTASFSPGDRVTIQTNAGGGTWGGAVLAKCTLTVQS